MKTSQGIVLAAALGLAAHASPALAQDAEWPKHGGGSSETYFSPLDQIDEDTVGDLAPAWFFEYDTQRGQEGEPIVVEGVMYISTAWSKVYALDAATGEEIWKYDPQVPSGSYFGQVLKHWRDGLSNP